jgi:CRP-like cAMP-binding protein
MSLTSWTWKVSTDLSATKHFEDFVVSKMYKKKHLLLREGQTSRRIFFIASGSARAYHVDVMAGNIQPGL